LDFSSFKFHESLAESIELSGYKNPTPIQEKTIPVILEGKDLIAAAQTGTGKTAAFLLPIIHKICVGQYKESEVHALIVVPTRELAIQISTHLDGLTYFSSISSIAIYGGGDGESFVREKQALSKGVDIVVATPGKLISHLNMGYVKMKELVASIAGIVTKLLQLPNIPLKVVPDSVLSRGIVSRLLHPLNIAAKFVPLPVSNSGIACSCLQLRNMLLKLVPLDVLYFGMDCRL